MINPSFPCEPEEFTDISRYIEQATTLVQTVANWFLQHLQWLTDDAEIHVLTTRAPGLEKLKGAAYSDGNSPTVHCWK
jgi:hypothetical protein